MRSPEPMPLPFRALLAEQIRAVGFAVSREAMLAGAVLALVSILSLAMAFREGDQLDFSPELMLPTLFVAAAVPFSVWKGDPAFGHALLWTLPVRHQHAAITKVLAGALWLMVAMLVTFVSLALIAKISGGAIGFARTRYLDGGSGTLAGATKLLWTTPWWMWVMPFVSALSAYLLVSAAILGFRYPVRVIVGVVAGGMLFSAMVFGFAPDTSIERGFESMVRALVDGPLGIDVAVTGGDSRMSRVILDDDGRFVGVLWSGLPTFEHWARAGGLWLALALGALAFAIRRHWER